MHTVDIMVEAWSRRDVLKAAAGATAACAGVSRLADGAAVPEHQGVLSTTYSIEVVDW